MTLIIAFAITLTLLYFVGIIVGSNIERQRWKEGKNKPRTFQQKPATPSSALPVLPDRPVYAQHQRMFNADGKLVWEQKTVSGMPGGQNVDIFA